MRLLQAISITALSFLSFAAADNPENLVIGAACSNDGSYNCDNEAANILVCQQSTWVLQAVCKKGCCSWARGFDAPHCMCE